MGNQRRFTKEYKEEIIRLVTEQGKKVYVGDITYISTEEG
ncbi:Hypothetical protein CCH01_007340 [Clostridium chauvoei JF4335]|uniref:Transposase n=1 Tax=Clostridium chauvoei JF4335 TaxID=1351755 RepID=S6F8S4_9CLOT|nr:Hypothetical protein CCH01_007340 [Clostridium chauvoei JF4335]SLK16496.1 Hypothetical protein CCH01_10600 [Clostridium chauvoei JF4335]